MIELRETEIDFTIRVSFARRFTRISSKRWPQLRDAKHRERRRKRARPKKLP
jgi:hypothetical protein